jgi:hypothetical protein
MYRPKLPVAKAKNHEAHTSSSKIGMGTSYGTGLKPKIGRMADTTTPGYRPVSPSQLKKPPKSVA